MNTVKTMQVLDGRIGAIPNIFSVILALKRKWAFNVMIYNFGSRVNKIFWIYIHTESQNYMSEETT